MKIPINISESISPILGKSFVTIFTYYIIFSIFYRMATPMEVTDEGNANAHLTIDDNGTATVQLGKVF